ncbi:MAG TPA: hypothetical protein VFZ09_42695 [Archangium sp.]|uniref:hypothetical protein n=1 Tax=Archangium sp. TaxID=1872627 RepID=UPI002E33DA84|nr:hypothetical protein [Archangium sp.]HEX5752990.1 hypothetical protein [Archangium sp.]
MEEDAEIIEEWTLRGVEAEMVAVLSELQKEHPELGIHWEVQSDEDAALTRREPLRDLNFAEILVTAVVSQAAKTALEQAFNYLRNQLAKGRSKVEKRNRRDKKR